MIKFVYFFIYFLIFFISINFIKGIFPINLLNNNINNEKFLQTLEETSVASSEEAINNYLNSLKPPIEDTTEINSSNSNLSYAEYFSNTLFVGDSITEGFEEFGFIDSYNVICGKGDTVLNGLEYISTIENINPKNIILFYGLNDVIEFYSTNPAGWSFQVFKDKYLELVESLQSGLPNSNIYLISPLPITETSSYQRNYRLTNKNLNLFRNLVQDVALETNSTYIDLSSLALSNENLHTSDGIHFQYDFYPMMLDYLKNYIN